MTKALWRLLAVLFAFSIVAAACGDDDGDDDADDAPAATQAPSTDDGDDMSAEAVSIEYWLWDGNQQPYYEQCAADFEAANPGIDVEITQFGWGDYWTNVTAGFASGSGPDVFTDHLARYPEFVASDVLVPLNDFVERDNVDTSAYFPGLAELWVDNHGNRYGLPKDFDTIALVMNSDHVAGAGVTAADFASAEWNPDDGGSFGELIRRLSVDANGNTGDSPDFDPDNVEVYGLGLEGNFGAFGQTTFSAFAGSTGFEFLDVNPFGDSANYDDPRLAATIDWFARMIQAGYVVPIEDVESLGGTTVFQNGSAAVMADGSWKIGTYIGADTPFAVEFAPLPVGPSGSRASMFNGLADSINKHSEHQEEAWQWVRHMASAACQDVIGEGAVVFPAIPSAAEIAIAAHEGNGVDVTAFTVHVDEGTTFLFPITDSASQIEAIVGPAMQEILRGQADAAERLAQVAGEVNAVLGS
ncbi:MAG: sugar ABC transporter substrate-binding protein [Acidimicrobiaceae bacterium]|nr:sugar ABC transporter substrate-binding protein [Acidimicrobiaceae bacterium]